MSIFRIIPVIDILNSYAVHAIKGERDKYKPLESYLFDLSEPFLIAEFLKIKYKFKEIYLADLDSIIYNNPNIDILLKIKEILDLKVILDPGIIKKEDIRRYSQIGINKLILGLETIDSFEVIKEGLKIFGKKNIILSLDMYKGNIISNIKELKDQTSLSVINRLENLGIQELILLDLFRVGQKIGGIPPLYLKIRKNFDGSILVGGGIRDFKDLVDYKNNNFSGVLIATALYDGSININKLSNFS